MGYEAVPLKKLAEQFASLPGIGMKTAWRLAFFVLTLTKDQAKEFADCIIDVHKTIKHCKTCQNFTEKEICDVCQSNSRDKSTICVVESPRDINAFERARSYKGTYHVLHGLISPMDGIGPDQIRIKQLLERISSGDIKEVIMATNPTVEGEATAMYISKLVKPFDIKVTRLAYGIPVGGELEYADDMTLSRALENRNEI